MVNATNVCAAGESNYTGQYYSVLGARLRGPSDSGLVLHLKTEGRMLQPPAMHSITTSLGLVSKRFQARISLQNHTTPIDIVYEISQLGRAKIWYLSKFCRSLIDNVRDAAMILKCFFCRHISSRAYSKVGQR